MQVAEEVVEEQDILEVEENHQHHLQKLIQLQNQLQHLRQPQLLHQMPPQLLQLPTAVDMPPQLQQEDRTQLRREE